MKKDNTALVQKGSRLIEESKNVFQELANVNNGLSSQVLSDTNYHSNGSSEVAKAFAVLQKVVNEANAANEIKKNTIRTTVDFSNKTHGLIQEHLKTHNHYKKIAPWLVWLAERELGLRR